MKAIFDYLKQAEQVKGDPQKQLDLIARFDREMAIALKQPANNAAVVNAGGEDPLITQYKNGIFNSKPSDDFQEIIKKVFALGLNIEDIKTGVLNWFAFNKTERLKA